MQKIFYLTIENIMLEFISVWVYFLFICFYQPFCVDDSICFGGCLSCHAGITLQLYTALVSEVYTYFLI